jgi:hypothetical protein
VRYSAHFERNVLIGKGVCFAQRLAAFPCGTTLCATLFIAARTTCCTTLGTLACARS